MSSATDMEERMRQGFAELLETLRTADSEETAANRARLAERSREASLARVRDEYIALGIEPEGPHVLSITAIQELGYRMPARAAVDQERYGVPDRRPADAYQEAGE